jgi:hypothetical protein
MLDDEERSAPPAVVGAVAAGTAPLPFLAVYSVMFIVHGGFHPVVPPDITNTDRGELIAGIIALALFVLSIVALLWMLNGRRRWPFVVIQLLVLGAAVDFIVDGTRGGRLISWVLVISSLVALGFAFAGQSWDHVGRPRPKRPRRRALPAGSGAGPDATPTSTRAIGRRSAGKHSESV